MAAVGGAGRPRHRQQENRAADGHVRGEKLGAFGGYVGQDADELPHREGGDDQHGARPMQPAGDMAIGGGGAARRHGVTRSAELARDADEQQQRGDGEQPGLDIEQQRRRGAGGRRESAVAVGEDDRPDQEPQRRRRDQASECPHQGEAAVDGDGDGQREAEIKACHASCCSRERAHWQARKVCEMAERFERHRQAWTTDEVQKLHTLAKKGMPLRAIAKALTRSEESVKERAKADKLGIAALR